MDSAIGRRGGKVLLAMNFNNCTFLLAFIRDRNNSQSVIDIFNQLERKSGTALFRKLSPVILTENKAVNFFIILLAKSGVVRYITS